MAIPNDPMNRPATRQVPRPPGGYSPQAVRDAQFQLGPNAPYLGMNPPPQQGQQPALFQPPQQFQMPAPQIPAAVDQVAPQQPEARNPFNVPMQQPMGLPPQGMMPGGRLPVGPDFYKNEASWYENPFNYQTGQRDRDFVDAAGPLKRAMQDVAANDSFTMEQKQAAFEKIGSALQNVEQAYQRGVGIIPQFAPTYGMPQPETPKEVFGAAPAGLIPSGAGFRNPQTGDVIPSVPTQTGEMLPRPSSQAQTDFLPAGTRYVDFDGKIKVAKGAEGAEAEATTAGTGRGAAAATGKALTRESLSKSFTTWSKDNLPGTSPEELAVLQSAANTPEKQALIAADPETLISQLAPDQRKQFNEARLRAFQRSFSETQEREGALAKMFGIEEPQQPKQPLDPSRYIVEAGSQGTVRVMRRGGNVAIPVLQGKDGQMRAAPGRLAELADLERDTEFVNIRPDPSGRVDADGNPLEIRMVPFSKETIDTQDFVMSDNIRRMLADSGPIRPRSKAEWDAFENRLSEFATMNEPWNPEGNPRQAELVKVVSDYYNELLPAGKLGMTLYIAQGLGYNVTGRGGKSMGFGGLENPQMKAAAEKAKSNAQYRFQPGVLASAFKAQAESLGNAPGELGSIARGVAGALSRPPGTSGSFRAAERGVTTNQRMQKAYDEQLQIIGANIAGHARLQAPGDYALGKRGNSQVEKALSEEVINQIPDAAMKEQLRKGLAAYFGWDTEAARPANQAPSAPVAAPQPPAAPAPQPPAAAPPAPTAPTARRPAPVTTDSQSFVSESPSAMDALRQLRGITARPSEMSNAPKKRREPKFGQVPEEVTAYDKALAEGREIIESSVAKNKAAEQEKKDAELRKLFGNYDPNARRFQPAPAKLKDMGSEPTSGDADAAIRSKKPEKRFAPGSRDETKERAGVPFEEAMREKSRAAPEAKKPAEAQAKPEEPVRKKAAPEKRESLPVAKRKAMSILEELKTKRSMLESWSKRDTDNSGPDGKNRLEQTVRELEEQLKKYRSRIADLSKS